MKKTELVLTGGVIALIAVAGWLLRSREALRAELTAVRGELRDTQATLVTAKEQVRRAEAATAAVTAAARGAVNAVVKSPPMERIANPMLKNWEDPQWRAARFNEAVIRVEGRYGRFFQKLTGWSPERIEALKRQMALNDLAVMRAAAPAGFPPTEAEQQAQGEALTKALAENEERLRAAAGDEDFAKLRAFEQADAHRQPVAAIANAMRAKGVVIGGELEESILTAYAEALRRAGETTERLDPRRLSAAEYAERRQKQLQELDRQMLKSLSGVLDEQQLDLFMQSLLEQERGGG